MWETTQTGFASWKLERDSMIWTETDWNQHPAKNTSQRSLVCVQLRKNDRRYLFSMMKKTFRDPRKKQQIASAPWKSERSTRQLDFPRGNCRNRKCGPDWAREASPASTQQLDFPKRKLLTFWEAISFASEYKKRPPTPIFHNENDVHF